ncbi:MULTISPECIES: helix-turn-helix domain-containing protein [Streptomyces]|uniref:DNA-binding protein n=1 Tax=Streptomyces katrae TaxID=68223 RepID=A0A0F4JAW3_9ACTN|nr:helix-turn-helix transcriptional regulator [Streptomyces katrae]KJY31350.1 DNA-binding protein [Streptomyces katrae]
MPPKKRPRANATTMKMIGRQVAAARVAKGYTQKQLAELVKVDEETVASIEQGRRRLMPNVAELLDFHLGLPGLLTVAALQMPATDVIPPWAEEFLDREREAIAISSYENQVMPGLLQTDAYADAVFRSCVPVLGEEEVAGRTTVRVRRREILRRKEPVMLSFVIWEPVLLLQLGGREVYREQLTHLRACSELPGVSLQIYPLAHSQHPSLDGPFVLLETRDHQRLAYMESQHGSHLTSEPNEVSIVERRYAMLRTQALNPAETRAEFDRLLGES